MEDVTPEPALLPGESRDTGIELVLDLSCLTQVKSESIEVEGIGHEATADDTPTIISLLDSDCEMSEKDVTVGKGSLKPASTTPEIKEDVCSGNIPAAESKGGEAAEEMKEPIKRQVYLCPFCSKDFSVEGIVASANIQKRLEHFKKCAADHRCTNPRQLRQFLAKEEGQEQDGGASDMDAANDEAGYLSDLVREVEKENKPVKDVNSVLMRSAKLKAKPDVNTYLMMPRSSVSKRTQKQRRKWQKARSGQSKGQASKPKPRRAAPLCKRVPGTAFVVDGFKFVSALLSRDQTRHTP